MTFDREAPLPPAVAELAVDFWKLLRVADRLLEGLSEDRRRRVEAQLRFSNSRLDQHLDQLGISFATFEGQRFGPELPAVAINAEDFLNVDDLVIESAVEPAVLVSGQVMQNARVMLKEGNVDVSGD